MKNYGVEGLWYVGNTLGKTNWNFNSSPCVEGFDSPMEDISDVAAKNVIECDCSYDNNTLCHVTAMYALSILFLFWKEMFVDNYFKSRLIII